MNFDGASDSKPALETVQEHHIAANLEYKPTKLRRFMSIGSRGSKPSSRIDMNTKPGSIPPLQTLLPRSTDLEPRAKRHTKRSISTFLLPTPFSAHEDRPADNNDTGTAQEPLLVTATASLSLPAAAVREVTAKPYQSVQSQPLRDWATKSFCDMPFLVSRTAALTSHPVSQEDLESDKFQTPRGFGGRQMGDHVEK
ncbi:uncharacterized protein M421DRAFT_1425 [Didymella exigua CBS 183.55]|uniref:Uncharacterized protein n=1 Tax=Didymella exigua CBS 183.55 TaxID=1150837 RepID=A0A6A5RYC7_9PLEO|nr:uncharacterized protein M421DRAFT_1425 [Didymella exigua CBS 183.55]KAF1932842.1 hypothetical protein M421DRAFT_1425 [Didymella exigua CBS 183.55]